MYNVPISATKKIKLSGTCQSNTGRVGLFSLTREPHVCPAFVFKFLLSGAAQADNYDGTIFAFTKIMWLQDAVTTLRSMLMDQAGFMSFDAYLKQCGSQLSQTHLRFWVEAQQILMSQGPQQVGVEVHDQIRKQNTTWGLFMPYYGASAVQISAHCYF